MALFHLLLNIVVFGLVLYTYFLKKQKRTDKNKIEIPWFKYSFCRVPIIDELTFLYKIRTRGLVMIDKLLQRFGPVLKIPSFGLTYLSVADADIIEKILKSNGQESLNKPLFPAFPDQMRNGLLLSPERIWSCHRKCISPVFNYGPITKYFAYTLHATRGILTQAQSCAANSKFGEINNKEMKKIIEQNAVKLITKIIMGDELSSFPESELAEFRENFESAKQILVEKIIKPYLPTLLILWIYPKKHTWESAWEGMNIFGNKIINKYRTKEAADSHIDEKKDTFHSLIKQMIKGKFSDEEISNEIITFLIVGHESLVTAIDMLVFHLAYNKRHQKICQDEIDKVLNAKNDPGNFTMRDVNELKYLERCIHESLRITPIVPAFIRTLKVPIKIDENLTLKPNKNLLICPWAVHRNPNYYPNPEKFDPDRFLPENIKKRHPCAYLPFSLGPRNCIGWKLAIMEMKVIMAGILSCFEMETTDKLSDVKLNFDVTIKPERPYNVTFKSR